MAEAVIVSAIQSLDSWLLKKLDLREDSFKKLQRLIVGMSDLGEEKKEILHSLLLEMAESWENHWQGDHDDWERDKEKLYNLVDLRKEKMCSLVAGMADFWEDNTERLYGLMLRVVDPWRDKEGALHRPDIYKLLVGIADLWGDDGGDLNKEKLHSLLDKMLVHREDYDSRNYMKEIRRASGEMAGLWKDKQPKLNKEKLDAWLAKRVARAKSEYLLGVLLDMAGHQHKNKDIHKSTTESVEGARKDLSLILDFIKDNKFGEDESSLRYFISDVVDMAHHARLLIQLQDSHPFSLFLELLVFQDLEYCFNHANWFDKKFLLIVNGLREIRVSMLEFGVGRLQSVGEMKGGENVVGLEEDVELLLHNEDIEAITIIRGMAGIGKTTLARQLYNHTTIAHQFERRAWVCLYVVLSRKEILLSLIRQVVDSKELPPLEKMERMDYKSLKQVLRQHLQGMRYFIVLDDVWENATHFKYVMKALPQDKGRRRLLLTTRSTGTIIDHFRDYNYKMKSMDDDKSWTLLLKTLFVEGSCEKFPKSLVKKARRILRKCEGLPLAIKEVGRQWAKKRQSGNEWEEIVESINLSETLAALESTYHNLDPQLKSCFLHLAFFKEGATIRVKKLVQIWIIGGLVSELEETFPFSLSKLSEESIIDQKDMVTGVGYQIKTCRIHAIFHKLSIMKAEDELNFEIQGKDGNNRPTREPRHRAIYCSREKLMNYSSNQDKHLVSLFFYGGGYFNASPSYWKHFEQLKTLDMEDFGLKILPDAIGTLIELRYLGLRNNYIQGLPRSLGHLKKLEVLDIALNFMLKVANIIWEMDSLRHVFMSDISFHKPLKIDALENLRTLSYVSIDSWTYDVSRLKVMTNLKRLGIEEVDENSDVRMLFASLAELNLYSLILRGFRFRSMPFLDGLGMLKNLHELKLEGLITELPSANNFPPHICYLSLINSCLHEDPMSILGMLSNLEVLKLQNAYTGKRMVISLNGFYKLKYLVIGELWHLRNVRARKGAMQMLQGLEINSCPYLETFPEEIFQNDGPERFEMTTTRKIATNIKESSFISRILKVDIHPYLQVSQSST